MIKQCSKCKKKLDISFFWKKGRSKDGLDTYCIKCRKAIQKKWLEKNKEKSKHGRRRYYLKNKDNLYRKKKERERVNPEKTKQQRKRYTWRSKLKRLYGISEEIHNEMVLNQLGRCAICGTSSKGLVVDHNHRTGKVRGLICSTCNIHLGYYEKDKTFHEKATKYLKKRSTNMQS